MGAMLVCLAALLAYSSAYGQAFVKKNLGGNTPGLYNGSAQWFDFDNDNDLDFMVTGQSSVNSIHTLVYQNLGNGVFQIKTNLLPFSETGLALLDVNHDDFIDIMLFGRAPGSSDLVAYLNNGAQFTLTNSPIDGFEQGGTFGTLAIGDINNDMLEDIFIVGIREYVLGNPVIDGAFYTKNTDFSYARGQAFDNPVYLAGAMLFDADGDGDLDLMFGGNDGVPPYQRTELWLNNNGTFLQDLNNAFVQLQNVAMASGDYDGDGDLDVVMTGLNASLNPTTVLYKNTNGVFQAVAGTGLRNHIGASGSVQWGDVDHDGDLDLLFSGYASDGVGFEVMINQGDGTFSQLAESNFELLESGHAAWGDYDNDGDLDILAIGYSDIENPRILVYENTTSVSNSPPSVPAGLACATNGNTATLSWLKSTDDKTAQPSITYNLFVKNFEGVSKRSAYANLSTGFRKLVGQGNAGGSTTLAFKNLDDGIYDWSVQSIDGGYASSAFAPPLRFYIGLPVTPTNLEVVIGDGSVDIDWADNSNNEEFTFIERSLGTVEAFETITTLATNISSYSDFELPPSFTAHYRLFTSNPNGNSGSSQVSTVSVTGTPTSLALSYGLPGVQLTWKDNSFNENEFVIERMVTGGSFVKIDSVGAGITNYTDDYFDDSVVSYRVYAKNQWGVSAASDAQSITITGITDVESAASIFPNPATQFVVFQLERPDNEEVIAASVIDMAGKRLPIKLERQSTGNFIVDVNDLATGMYVLQVKTGRTLYHFKFIK